MKSVLCGVLAVVLVSVLTLSGCAGPGGVLLTNGKISPCPGYHTDNQACGNAVFNARVIGQVAAGQTKEQVRDIMKHDAERREIDGNEERWSYITDYQAEQMTVIVFTESKVSGMKQEPWKEEN